MLHAAMHGSFAEKIVHCFRLNVWWIVEVFSHSPWYSVRFSLGDLDPYQSSIEH